MASTYLRNNSKYIWIQYRSADGTWKRKSSGKLSSNANEKKEAEMMARKLTLKEKATFVSVSNSSWQSWVPAWIETRWGNKTNDTPQTYRIRWRNILGFLDERSISVPAALTRDHVTEYLAWRIKHGVGRNTAIGEITLLSQVLKEAVRRNHATDNVANDLQLERDEHAEKSVWTDEEVARVGDELHNTAKYGWMHVSFLMGLHQAVRISQSQVPLVGIDFNRRVIDYPGNIVKGGKGYAQPMAPEFFDTLKEIVEHRKGLGKPRLCELPQMSSFVYRNFLDGLGLKHLCHHGLRASWITRAALAGVPESLSMRFVHHSSSQVHKIYQRITADDLLPMLDAMRLKRIEQGQAPGFPGNPSLTEAKP